MLMCSGGALNTTPHSHSTIIEAQKNQMDAPTLFETSTKGDGQGPEYNLDSLFPAQQTHIFTSPHSSASNMLTDDLPWPELGNVSRGATRGNQGQKGVLTPPDNEGRSTLQLRVQPGVLPVRLNRQATEWYRTLDGEVNRALKLTKTYWRKARRRQDYDARADQDHMELHEWLQQLKDKVMSHLELLMQKGEIQGPPYIMPDNVELTFLRKFIERHAAGIPHNPRLRQNYLNGNRSPRTIPQYNDTKFSEGSSTSPAMSWEALDDRDKASQGHDASPTLASFSDNVHTVVGEVESNRRALKSARAALGRAQKDTQDSFRRYKACLDIEAQALQQVSAAEERRDALMASLVDACRVEGSEASETSSRKSFAPEDTRPSTGTHVESRSSPKQIHDQIPCSYKNNGAGVQEAVNGWRAMRDMQWSTPDVTGMTVSSAGVATVPYQPDMQMDVQEAQSRKHSRSWDIVQGQTEIEEFSSIPPRKRYQLEDDPTMAASRSTLTMRRSSFPAMQSQGMGHLEQVMVTHA